MNHDFRQYQFARIEGHSITRARLAEQFKDRITDLGAFEKEIQNILTTDLIPCAPWRSSGIEETAFREGVRLAALEFYWEHREQLLACETDLQLKEISLMFPALPKQLLN